MEVVERRGRSSGRRVGGCAVLLALPSLLCCGVTALAQGPGGPVTNSWHASSGPRPIASHDFVSHPDTRFLTSGVGLASRFNNPLLNVNANARSGEGRVMLLAPSGFGAANSPAQSLTTANQYAFSNWQYIDSYVYWGGSAGEGNILSPQPGLVDAAHRNGVKVYGNVFFAPTAYGGNIQQVNDFLVKRPDGSFPVADKMLEAMNVYGFDGYFINQETAGGNAATAAHMRDFMKYFQREAGAGKELIWYDAMTSSGSVWWQERLNDRNMQFFQDAGEVVSEKMFLDFGWNSTDLSASKQAANAVGRSEHDLYAGVNTQPSGYNQYVNWEAVFPEGQAHRSSLALYVPNWTFEQSQGDTPLSRMEDYRQRESNLWVGAHGDPSDTSGTVGSQNWKGLAHYIPAKSSVVGDVFVTNFNIGQGVGYFVDGERVSDSEWTNLSVQDVMPTWRWVVDSSSSNPVSVGLDYTDAYHGGASLAVAGNLDSQTDVRLYATNLDLHDDSRLHLAYKSAAPEQSSSMQVLLAFDDNPTVFTDALEVDAAAGGVWDLAQLDLSGYSGRTVSQIGLRFLDADNAQYQMNVGRLGVVRGEPTAVSPPSQLEVAGAYAVDQDTTALRLVWSHSPDHSREPGGNGVYNYNVFRRNPDGSRTFLGATSSDAFYVPALDRLGGERSITLEVEALSDEFARSSSASFVYDWQFLPAELLANGDFEQGLSSWFDGAGPHERVYEGEDGGDGTRSAGFSIPDSSATSDLRSFAVAVEGQEAVRFSYTYKVGAGSTGEVRADFRMFGGDGFLGEELDFLSVDSSGGDWVTVTKDIPLLEGTTAIDLVFSANAFTEFVGEFRVDEVSVLLPVAFLSGDFDLNGVVNGDDYEVWRRSYGSVTDLSADANQDGRVGPEDYTVWRDNLGRRFDDATSAQAVPEPASAVVLAVLLSLCWPGRRPLGRADR